MKKLYRSKTDVKLAGICGGIAEMFGLDPTLVRLAVFFIILATGIFPGLLTYFVAWWIIPQTIQN